eukprot:1501169-Prymnesium_polylepis.1
MERRSGAGVAGKRAESATSRRTHRIWSSRSCSARFCEAWQRRSASAPTRYMIGKMGLALNGSRRGLWITPRADAAAERISHMAAWWARSRWWQST